MNLHNNEAGRRVSELLHSIQSISKKIAGTNKKSNNKKVQL